MMIERADFLKRVKFILKFGKAMHSVGAPAHTLESTIQGLCSQFGIKGSVVSIPTAIFSSFTHGEDEVTKIERVEPRGIDLGRLSKVDLVSQEVLQGQITFEEGAQALDAIDSTEVEYAPWIRVVSFVMSSIGFMILFGGNWADLVSAAFVGLLIGLLSLMRPIGVVAQIFEGAIAMLASFMAYILLKLIPGLNVGVVILSSIIIFMPGLFITIAIAEIATQNLTSGTSRLMGGAMILLKLAFGVFLGSKVASWFHMPSLGYEFERVPDWMIMITLPLTSLMSVVIFKADRTDWKWVTLAGVFGYACSKLGTFYLGSELGMFFGGVCVGAMSNVFARLKNKPSSIFQFPGIILLVPGSVGYRSLNFLFERNVVGGLDTAWTMITIAMALVVGILIGNIVIKPRRAY